MSDETEQNLDTILKAAEARGLIPSDEEVKALEGEPEVEPEVKPEPKKEPEVTEEEREILHPKVIALSRRENVIRKRESELKDLEKQKQEFEQQKKSLDGMTLSEFVKQKNYTYEQALKEFLGTGDKPITDQESALAVRLEKIEKQTAEKEEQLKKQKEELDLKVQQEEAEKYVTSLRKFLDDGAEKYELITASDNHKLVLDTVLEHYNETGEELPWEQAAERIEAFLEEELTKKIEKLLNTSKIKNKLGKVGKSEPKKPEPIKAGIRQQEPTTKTLSNKNTASNIVEDSDIEDPEEAYKQALAFAREKLI